MNFISKKEGDSVNIFDKSFRAGFTKFHDSNVKSPFFGIAMVLFREQAYPRCRCHALAIMFAFA